MNKLRLNIGVILVFLVGALAGSMGTGMYIRHRIEKFPAYGPKRPTRTTFFMKRLSKKLDLTQDQRVEIKKIVEEADLQVSAIRNKYLPEIKEINDQSLALMKEKLNPDQKEKLQKLHERLRNRYAKASFQSIQTEETAEQVLHKMKKRLKLTEEQETKVRPIIEGRLERERKTGEKYKKQASAEMLSLRQEIREIQKSTEKSLSEILTEKQMEEYRKIQKEGRLGMRPRMRKRR